MNYFTFEWWSGIQMGEVVDALDAYRKHLATIEDQLPADLLRLEHDISIHDAHVQKLHVDVANSIATLLLDGYDKSGALRRFKLTFKKLVLFESITNGKVGLAGPGGYGHLGYWESDVIALGIEFRILFSSGIEKRLVFKEFELELEYEDALSEISE